MVTPGRTRHGAIALATIMVATATAWNLAAPTPASAGPPNAAGQWVVDGTGDGGDSDLGDNDCNDGTGACTFRAAVENATQELQTASSATIIFEAGPAPLITVGTEIAAVIPTGTTLQISGVPYLENRPTLSGGTTSRILSLSGDGDVSISGVVFADGQVTGSGGAVQSNLGTSSTLRLTRVTFEDNLATGSGGALSASHDVEITDSQFLRNTANVRGSGADFTGEFPTFVTVDRTSFVDNLGAISDGGAISAVDRDVLLDVDASLFESNTAEEGGAIYCECFAAQMTRSSVVGNTAGGFGGVYLDATEGVTLNNTTVADNQSTFNVNGGAYIVSNGVEMRHSTIANNTSAIGGTGAVFIGSPANDITIENTILTGNSDGCIIDSPTVVGVNFWQPGCAPVGTPDLQGTIDATPPALEALGDAGGSLTGVGDPLPVLVPAAGSAVVDVASCVLTTDGRSLPRPASGCDVGAVELDPDIADDRVFTVDNPNDAVDAIVGDGICASVVGGCTLRAAILEADASANPSTIEFTGAAVGRNLTQIPATECSTTTDNAFCGDYDILRSPLTIRGVDEPTAPRSTTHPVELAQIDDHLFEVSAPSFTLDDLTLVGNSVERILTTTASNSTLNIFDSTFLNGTGIDVSGPSNATLFLDEVEFENVDDNDFLGAIVTARDTTLARSQIGLSDGGTLTSTDGALTIIATNFVDNTSISNGTPLIDCSATCGPVTMTETVVFRNSPTGAPALDVGDQPATITNSSFTANGGLIGAIRAGAGGIDLSYTTVAFNSAGGNPGSLTGGLDLSSGPATLTNSIVTDNDATTGAGQTDDPDNCQGGEVTLIGVNAFSAAGGNCTIVGDAPATTSGFADPSPFQYTTSPRGEAAWFQIVLLPELAPELIDSISPDDCGGEINPFVRPDSGGSFADARGMARPTGNGCEPGALEVATLAAGAIDGDVVIDDDNAEISTTDLDPALDATITDGVEDLAGASSTELRAIDLDATPLRQVPLRQVPLGALATDSELLDAITLSQLPLGYASASGDGWPAYLADQATPENGLAALVDLPLNTVSLGQVVRALSTSASEFGLPDLEINQIDFSATPLGALPIGALALGAATLTDIDSRLVADGGTDWCAIIAEYTDTPCGAGAAIDPATASLVTINLLGVPLRQVPLRQVPLRQVDLTASPLRQVPLRQVEITATPLRQVPLRQVDLVESPLRQVPLRQVLIEGSPLRQVPLRQVDLFGSPLRQVPLRQVSDVGSLIDCAQFDCNDGTIGDAFAGFSTELTLGDIVDRIDVSVELGAALDLDGTEFVDVFGALTLGDIVDWVAAGFELGTLGDIGGPEHPDAYGDEAQGAAFTLGYLLSILAGDVDFGQLGDVDAALFPDVVGSLTLGELYDLVSGDGLFDEATLGELGGPGFPDAYGDENSEILLGAILDILQQFFGEDATLGDLLAGILPASEYPWERVDLTDPANLEGALAATSFATGVDIGLPENTVVEATLTLPPGWRFSSDSLALNTAEGRPTPLVSEPTSMDISVDPRTSETIVRAEFDIVRPAPDELVFDASPPLELVTADPVSLTLLTREWSIVQTPVESGPTTVRDAFEDGNDTIGGALDFGPDPDSRLFLTHIGEPEDVDWFSIDIAQGTKLSAYLGNLPDDYDLLLYGPAQSALRGAPSSSLEPSPDGGLSLIGLENSVESQIADDIDTTPPNANLRLFGSSTRRGVGDERIDTAALPAGTYYLRVSAFGGVSSVEPYSLRVRTIDSSISGVCGYTPGPVPAPPALDPSVFDLTSATNTLVLTNLSRMARSYPDASVAAAAIESFVTTVNSSPGTYGGVRAAVVELDDLAAYSAWDADACNPGAANAVVTAIGDRIDGIVAAHPNIDNIVLVGADDQIPFARVVDAVPANNESDYAVTFDGTSPLSAAQSLGYVLTDNPYGTANPIAVGPRELFVPELAIGRLVESPTDVAESLGHFVDFEGRLDVSTALSTGYDFLTDGAEAVSRELTEPRGLVAESDLAELISDDWTRADLRDALVGGAPDLASVNAHFDHYRALPADQDTAGVLDDPFLLSDVADAVGDPLLGSVIFSMGCHSGLSVDDISVGGPLSDDWAQTFAGEGAVFAGNTGYGYGDDTVVGATEELMRQFAARLDGSLTVGEAMAFAKQRYTADLLIVSPFDEKVVSQVVFYGLPMYRLGSGDPAPPIVNPPAVTDPDTGLDVVDASIAPDIVSTVTDNGVVYETTSDGYVASPFQPVQPKVVLDVTQDGRQARGAMITGLSTSDVAIDPVYVTPNDDTATPIPEANIDDAVFPSVPQTISRYADPNGERDQLVVVTGQFTDDPATNDGSGTQRLFDEFAIRVFYAPPGNTDVEPATISSSQATVIDGNAVFEVVADDLDGSIAQVLVLFTDANAPGTWTPVLLEAASGRPGTFVGAAPATGAERVDYFVQVVDDGGNVAVSTNKGAYYEGDIYVPPPPPPTAPTIALPDPGPSGEYSGTVTATITPGSAGGPVAVRVDGAEPIFSSTVDVNGSGLHTITATGPNGATSEVSFVIAVPVVPTLTVSITPPAESSGWHLAPTTVTITGTGVASISTSVDGDPFTTVSGTTAIVSIVAEGASTLRYFGTTVNGDATTTQVRTIRVDTLDPVVVCPAATYLLREPEATLTADVADVTSGVTTPTVTVDVPTDQAGTFEIPVTASDVAGNSVTVGCSVNVTYRVDGFFDPVDADEVNRARAGRTVPLHWRLTDFFGEPIDDPDSFVRIGLTPESCDGDPVGDEVSTAGSKSGLEYLGDGEWQYNWKTDRRQTGCVDITLDVLGAVGALEAQFLLR